MFHKTPMGRKFFESDVPRLINALETIAKELHKSNINSTPTTIGQIIPAPIEHERGSIGTNTQQDQNFNETKGFKGL